MTATNNSKAPDKRSNAKYAGTAVCFAIIASVWTVNLSCSKTSTDRQDMCQITFLITLTVLVPGIIIFAFLTYFVRSCKKIFLPFLVLKFLQATTIVLCMYTRPNFDESQWKSSLSILLLWSLFVAEELQLLTQVFRVVACVFLLFAFHGVEAITRAHFVLVLLGNYDAIYDICMFWTQSYRKESVYKDEKGKGSKESLVSINPNAAYSAFTFQKTTQLDREAPTTNIDIIQLPSLNHIEDQNKSPALLPGLDNTQKKVRPPVLKIHQQSINTDNPTQPQLLPILSPNEAQVQSSNISKSSTSRKTEKRHPQLAFVAHMGGFESSTNKMSISKGISPTSRRSIIESEHEKKLKSLYRNASMQPRKSFKDFINPGDNPLIDPNLDLCYKIEAEFVGMLDQVIIACDDQLNILYNNYHDRFLNTILNPISDIISMQNIKIKFGIKLDSCFQQTRLNSCTRELRTDPKTMHDLLLTIADLELENNPQRLQDLFSTPSSKTVVFFLLKFCKIAKKAYLGSSQHKIEINSKRNEVVPATPLVIYPLI